MVPLPDPLSVELVSLLAARSKNEEQRLLSGFTLTPDALYSLIMRCGEHGFVHALHQQEFTPADIMPTQEQNDAFLGR